MSKYRIEPSTRRRRGSRRVGVLTLAGFSLLLITPALALSRFTEVIDWPLLAAVPIALSLATFAAYRSDKRSAEAGTWRIPETTLHLAELAGGWPGAFLAQRAFRHKISKTSYQVEFWIIVLLHQVAAADSLMGWRLATGLWGLAGPRMG